ncbi:MAG: alkyl hydroperoxide reductase [Gemmatimonadetes bacterium]|nr:MAG: alkyl hydroperoxide reductase [Gemmatimonadota bacterium]
MLPQLRELEQRFPESVAVVGVHSGKYIAERDTERIRDASIRLGATHPVLNDRQFRVWRAYAVRAWPTLVAIDPRGSVVGMSAGEFTVDAVTPFVERVVAAARADGSLREGPLHFPVEPPSAPTGALAFPGKVAVRGDRIAVADSGHHRILIGWLESQGLRMRVERVVGSGNEGFVDGRAAAFRYPQGLVFGGDDLYIADTGNHAVRAIALGSGATRTIAGTGAQLRTARDRAAGALSSPWDLALSGDTLHVAMAGIHQLWTIDLRHGVASRRTGSGAEELYDGSHTESALAQTMGVAIDGDTLLAADAESSAVREVDLAETGGVRTIVGTGLFDFGNVDGVGDAVRLQHPQGIAVAPDGRVLVCDSYNDALRWLDRAERRVTTWVRGLHEPGGVAIGARGAYVADTNAHRLVVADWSTAELHPVEIVTS